MDLDAALNVGGKSGIEEKVVSAQEAEIERLKKIIEGLEDAALQAVDKADKASMSQASTKERWAIVIEESDNLGDLSFAPVGVNGRVYQIARGRVVEVPPEVIEVLDHAIVNKDIPVTDPVSGNLAGTRTRKMRRFAYQKLGKAIDANGDRVQEFEDLNAPDFE